MAKCIMELERIYGIKNGGDRGNQYVKKEADGNNFVVTKIQFDLSHLLNICPKLNLGYF